MAEHNALTGSSLHEPKGIDSAGTSDAGKVITPSSSTAGISELRRLNEDEISNRESFMSLHIEDISTASTEYLVAPFSGTLTKVWSAIGDAITGTDATLTVKINGSTVSPGTMTITATGSAAGDVDSVVPTSANTFSEGDTLEVQSDGASSGVATTNITFKIER